LNPLVHNFFQKVTPEKDTPFLDILYLDEENPATWEQWREKCPSLPRGWYELSHLPVHDRIEFTREYWINILPYHPIFHHFLMLFFARLDDVGVYLTQTEKDKPYGAHFVYSLASGNAFYRGNPPITEDSLLHLKKEFNSTLPRDFLAFYKIHNGFAKSGDTGIIPSEFMKSYAQEFYSSLLTTDRAVTCRGQKIDPSVLIPFYECFGLHSFQCFYGEWYPANEMGNVYFSGVDYTISDYTIQKAWGENMAFPTFLDWLIFYLEEIE